MVKNIFTGILLANIVFAGGTYQTDDLVENISTETCYPNNNTEWTLYDHFGNVNGGDYQVIWVILFSASSHVSQIEAEFTENLFNQYRNNGLVVIGAGSEWENGYSCDEWGTEFGLSYPIADDSNMNFRSLFTDGSVPHHVLLDHQMRVIYSAEGTIIPPTGNQFLNALNNALEDLESLMIIPHIKDWNMVGLPLDVSDESQTTVYPGSVEGTLFSFDGTYVNESELVSGDGYWLNFPYSGHAALSGNELTNLTISLNAGWNIISGISEETDMADIFDPDEIVIPGSLYGFDGTYVNVLSLQPGKGYWINAFSAGNITFTSGGTSGKVKSSITDVTHEANVLNINHSKLYFGVSVPANESVYYQLPPKPPAGAFDIRFDTNLKIAKDFGHIEILNNEENLLISTEFKNLQDSHWDWVITTQGGREYILAENSLIELNGQVTGLTLKKIERIPDQYSLSQNYPNPFNPVTTLDFTIPEQGNVDLIVFDLLGNEIRKLIQNNLSAGFHSVQWDGMDNNGNLLSAGCYFYQLKVSSSNSGFKPEYQYVQTRKMVLLK
ncbi:MAG: FlgD immunoglobulin-like domain containing protein [Candidatus Marinimicrobia bacterium]|jgi:hypothetical protein|nr:FlgD immunoglobulin-like domain containing protein [Candidatus Neomarinimicrobiota bacterium]